MLKNRQSRKIIYYINKADFVACHVPAYIVKDFPIVRDVKPGGVFLINCQWSFEELEQHLDAASKRYIAKNDIQLYMINAIDLAQKIGMGKRTNTILQSAFFTLAKVIPQEDAIKYMKEKATASYLKKGQDIVDMNHNAIDAGATAFVKVEVPASWAEAEDKAAGKSILLTCPMILAYNVFEASYSGMISETMSIISAVIGIIRYKKDGRVA